MCFGVHAVVIYEGCSLRKPRSEPSDPDVCAIVVVAVPAVLLGERPHW